MTHSVPMTFSPSSLRITRSTPWVDGCCGPMLRTNSVESRNVVSGMVLLAAFDVEVLLHPAVVLLDEAVLFSEREALPLFGEKNAAHIGVAFELDAEHVEHLTLEPVGRRVNRGGGGRFGLIGDGGLDADPLVAG